MKILLAISIILGLLRICIGLTVPPEPLAWLNVYKDMAHVFIGGLGVLWWQKGWIVQWFKGLKGNSIYDFLFWGLCILEVGVAVLSRVT